MPAGDPAGSRLAYFMPTGIRQVRVFDAFGG